MFQSLDVLQDNFQWQDNQKKENFYSENISGMIYILLTLAWNDRVPLYITSIPAEAGEDKSGSKNGTHLEYDEKNVQGRTGKSWLNTPKIQSSPFFLDYIILIRQKRLISIDKKFIENLTFILFIIIFNSPSLMI